MKQAIESGKIIWILAFIAFSYVVWFNFNTFVVRENYDFYVEAPCDTANGSCYLRDCEEEECPPNGLEIYKVWKLSAKDFRRCSDDSCARECSREIISCEEVACDPEEWECS